MPKAQQTRGSIRVPVPLPMKGVNRNFARGNQPDGTCWDAMNILPFDRQGRLRVAQRGGAGKTESLSGSKVRMLHLASFATTPTGGSTTVFSEPFTYTDGDLTGNAAWAAIAFYDSWVVNTNNVTVVPSTASFADWANQNDAAMAALTLATDDYTVDMVVNVPSTDFPLIEIFPEGDNAGDPTAAGNYKVDFQWDAPGSGYVNMVDGYASGTLTNFDLPQDADTTLSIVVTSRSVQVKVNGVTIQTRAISSTTAAFKRFAFRASGVGITTDNGVTVKSLTISTGGTTSISRSVLKLIAVDGADTWIGEPTNMSEVSNDGTYPIDTTSMYVSAATLFGITYIVDSTNIYSLDLSTSQFVAYSASAGSAPTGCTIAVAWRGRLVLSGSDNDPQNVFASKIGDPTNWDTGIDPPTPDMAWEANAATSGRVGEPVLALIPLSDDILLILGEQSVWAVRGDITDGGTIDNISNEAGIVGPKAWTRAADGSVYFVGPNGLYRANPDGSAPVEISRDVFREYFQSINRDTNHVVLTYDKTRYGIWIFVTPEDNTNTPGSHLFYDLRLEGYWPQEFTNLPVVGPLSAVYWDGFTDADRYPSLGSYDGSLYAITFNNRRDNDGVDNVAIPANITLGPISLSSVDDAVLTKIDITGGEVLTGDDPSVWNINMTVNGGESAYSVTEGTAHTSIDENFTVDGRQMTRYPRVRGGWFSIRFFNGNSEASAGDYFSLENVVAHVMPAGNQRVGTSA